MESGVQCDHVVARCMALPSEFTGVRGEHLNHVSVLVSGVARSALLRPQLAASVAKTSFK